ncbi:MAG TPA: pilus assembly PilX N-terminal domain-containing protein [Patescibacteria group bacterium]|nr:pilus assembly PilX N-terminal domain-containing protein [Patescibacteria group bacterium]
MKRAIASTPTSNRQAGMVSILVTMVLMIVLSLVVLGFAQIARRNERQSLDRQLSTQAFYAAEAGINDVVDLIKTASGPITAKPDCNNSGPLYSPLNALSTLDAATNVTYSCVTVDPAPPGVSYSLDGVTSFVLPIIPASGTISQLTFTWKSTDPANPSPALGCPSAAAQHFSDSGNWAASNCGYGVLRFDLVPTGGALTASSLEAGTMSSFVVPLRSGGSAVIPFSASGSQDLVGTRCTNGATAQCSVTINSGLGGNNYFLRIGTLYKPATLLISGKDGSGSPVAFSGLQAVIDATGKAQDVLRRVQVRIPLPGAGVNKSSDYAIQSSGSVCKRFVLMSNYYKSEASADVPSMDAGTNPLCL